MRLSRIYPFLLMILALSCLAAGGAGDARAEVSININLGPPPIVVAEPPEIVMVPGSRVYFVPDPHIDVFFYGGFWWSPRGSRWYRARAYDGPWVHMAPSAVPRAVVYMPRDYRVRYGHERPVPYGHWKKDHSRWEKERWQEHKHWEKEREREWKQHKKQDRYERHGDHREYRDDDRRGSHGGPGPR